MFVKEEDQSKERKKRKEKKRKIDLFNILKILIYFHIYYE
jgi:hypothetical protein